PAVAAQPLAVLVTVLETTLGLALLLGLRTRAAAGAAAALLFLFATAMTVVLGPASQAEFGVYVMCVGALALALSDDPARWSVDAWLARRRSGNRPAGGAIEVGER